MSKVFIVDDDESVIRALRRTLELSGVTVEARKSAREFLENREHDEPACVLLDLRLPEVNGLEVQRRLNADPTLPVIFLTGFGTIASSVEAMKQGAFEFLLKPVDGVVLVDVVTQALARSADALERRRKTTAWLRLFSQLTPREREVARLVAEGLLNKQIAARLGISVKTVKIHRARAIHKLGVHSVVELVRVVEHVSLLDIAAERRV